MERGRIAELEPELDSLIMRSGNYEKLFCMERSPVDCAFVTTEFVLNLSIG